jgi:hypothetical protein
VHPGSEISVSALRSMVAQGGHWSAWQNIALDSASLGQIIFIKYGLGCTFETRPDRCPDTQHGMGWKYSYIGDVSLETGQIDRTMHVSFNGDSHA